MPGPELQQRRRERKRRRGRSSGRASTTGAKNRNDARCMRSHLRSGSDVAQTWWSNGVFFFVVVVANGPPTRRALRNVLFSPFCTRPSKSVGTAFEQGGTDCLGNIRGFLKSAPPGAPASPIFSVPPLSFLCQAPATQGDRSLASDCPTAALLCLSSRVSNPLSARTLCCFSTPFPSPLFVFSRSRARHFPPFSRFFPRFSPALSLPLV